MRISWRPTRELFSGWNWVPATRPQADRGDDPARIRSGRDDMGGIVGLELEAVHEIEIGAVRDAGEQRLAIDRS